MRLTEKVAVITGAGSGIGRGTAVLFAKEGAKVVLTGRRRQPLEDTAAEIRSGGGEALVFPMDISKKDDVTALFAAVKRKYGKIDVLFNNAGGFIGCGKKVADVEEEEFDALVGINLKGTFLCCKYVIPYMRQNKNGGSIINCSSISGHIGQRANGAYNMTKGGIEMLTKNIALDYAEDHIRANTVCPAWVEIEFNKEDFRTRADEIKALHPIGRTGTPEDVGYAVVYLASDESSWVTGASFMVDGGYTAQ